MSDLMFQLVLPGYLVVGLFALGLRFQAVYRQTRRNPIRSRPFRDATTPSGFAESALLIAAVTLAVDVLSRAVCPREIDDVLTMPPLRDAIAVRWSGFVTMTLGLGFYFAGLAAMGASWRIGIDREGAGALVVGGPFAHVRHPLYSGILLATLGLMLLIPDALAIAATSAIWTAVPIQARLEEEFLAARHPEYEEYRSRTGRFLPKWF